MKYQYDEYDYPIPREPIPSTVDLTYLVLGCFHTAVSGSPIGMSDRYIINIRNKAGRTIGKPNYRGRGINPSYATYNGYDQCSIAGIKTSMTIKANKEIWDMSIDALLEMYGKEV